MWEILRQAWSAIPAASTNTRALIAYCLTVIAWAFIAFRVKRNQNLLANLQKLPETDRLRALESEMGRVKLREGLSPENWLRYRTQLYYFLAFVVLCVLVLGIFAMAAFAPASPAAVGQELQRAIRSEVQESQDSVLDDLDVGATADFVNSKLGPPKTNHSPGCSFHFDLYSA